MFNFVNCSNFRITILKNIFTFTTSRGSRPQAFCKKAFLNFWKFYKKTCVADSHCCKVTSLFPITLLKKALPRVCSCKFTLIHTCKPASVLPLIKSLSTKSKFSAIFFLSRSPFKIKGRAILIPPQTFRHLLATLYLQ